MLSITVYPEGPSCLPSQTVGEETTSDSSNSEESPLDTKRSKCREQCFSQPRSRAATVQKVGKSKKLKPEISTYKAGETSYSCKYCGWCFIHLLGVEILEVICRKYIPQLIKKLLISCLTKTNSVLTVLTLPRVVLICSVTSVPTLERSHTLVQNVTVRCFAQSSSRSRHYEE